MRIFLINLILVLGIMFSNTAYGQNQRIIRDVILLDVQPYEVLMTEKGDIIARLRHIPDYLTSNLLIPSVETKSSMKPTKEVDKAPLIAQKETEPLIKLQTVNKRVIQKENSALFKEDYYEIVFARGTATLSPLALKKLNELAVVLKMNPDRKVQVFGFQNESPTVAYLLSKRRRDGCVAYLKIKGVAVSKQVFKGSVTRGSTNKIVFGFE